MIDSSAFRDALKNIANNLPSTVDKILNDLAIIGQQSASTSTLYKGTTLRKRIIIQDGSLAKTILADAPYAYWVENGNGPPGSKIYPKSAKALRFVIDGQVFFRKWVRASAPRPFMQEAHNLILSQANQVINSRFKELYGK